MEGGKRVEKAFILLDKKYMDLGGFGKWDDGARTRGLSGHQGNIRKGKGATLFKMENSGWGFPELSEGGKRVEKALALLDKKYMDLWGFGKWDDLARTRDLPCFNRGKI